MIDLAERSGVPVSAGDGLRVSVARLTLGDFRCFRALRIETGPAPVVVTGPNGAGKTSLLEALSFLAPGNGLRRAKLDDVAYRPAGGRGDPGTSDPGTVDLGSGAWAVAARVRTPGGPVEIGTGRQPAAGPGARERRVTRVDGRPVKSLGALTERFGVVWLTPDMDRLFQEGASSRRRFLDRIVYGADPRHADRVAAFERAMRERARLLRDGRRDGRRDPVWLAALEDAMARHAVATVAARREVTARLAVQCAEGTGAFPGAVVEVTGRIEAWLDQVPALAVEDRVRAALAETRAVDAEQGTTSVGAHRSDLRVRHGRTGRPAADCSTGEQKALLIAIVLAAACLQAAERGAVPLLLLDEVAAHLDARRRAALFEEIDAIGAQAWYTGTDRAVFLPLRGRAQTVEVDEGHVATVLAVARHE